MTKQQLENLIRKHPRKVFAFCIPLGLLLAAIPISCDMRAQERLKASQTATAKQQAELEAFKQKQRAEDEVAAQTMNMTYREYKAIEALIPQQVWKPCRKQVEQVATWGADWNFLPEYRWAKNGDTIVLWGNDVEVKNGFNAQRQVDYRCEYSITTGKTRLTKFDGQGL